MAAAPPPLLDLRHLSHTFTGEGGETLALHDLSFRVVAGEFVTIVGPSGGGKSTLLRLIAGILTPDSGRILYEGEPLVGTPADIGMVFQAPTLLPWRSVRDNVRLPLDVAGQADDGRVGALIEAVGLHRFADATPAELSGGMQQRVALARALITEPRLLLMDEPFGALDMLLRSEMNLLLQRLWLEHRPTVLFVTHDLHEALFLADRVLAIGPRPGRLIGELAVPLPRPRAADSRYGPEAQALVSRLWAMLERPRPAAGTDNNSS